MLLSSLGRRLQPLADAAEPLGVPGACARGRRRAPALLLAHPGPGQVCGRAGGGLAATGLPVAAAHGQRQDGASGDEPLAAH